MKLLLSKPRGFCAGVVRAIKVVEKALEIWDAPVYVKHEIVHNSHVVNRLKEIEIFIWQNFDQVSGKRVVRNPMSLANP